MPTIERETTESALLGELLKKSLIELREMTDEKLKESKEYIEKQVEELRNTVTKNINEIGNKSPLIVNLGTVETPDKKVVHSAFHKVIKVLSSAKRKEKNIMLVGAAGGGKTHLCKSVAEALKLQFYPMSVGLQTTKSDLIGFINAHGNYITSPIREAYEKGGVLLLDEFDACHAGVVTILNSLLANGHCSFPDKIVDKNEKFVCICACNTFGRGGNVEYVGRNRLDAATLDRFIVVDVDYDENLEDILTNNPFWLSIVRQIRNNADRHGIKIIISPRAAMDGADLLEAGFTVNETLDMTIFKGVPEDVKTKLKQDLIIKETTKKTATAPTKGRRIIKNIYIDFDNDRYNVSTTFPDFDLSVGDINIKICVSYTPYLQNDTLWLNPTSRKFEQSTRIADADDFISELLEYGGASIRGLEFDLKLNIISREKEYEITLKKEEDEIF